MYNLSNLNLSELNETLTLIEEADQDLVLEYAETLELVDSDWDRQSVEDLRVDSLKIIEGLIIKEIESSSLA